MAMSNANLQTAHCHFIATDHLGTPQIATNQSSAATWKAAVQAFGTTIPNQDNLITMNLRFPGQYFDQETGAHHNYFKDYSPQTGRYIQRDSIGLNGGINVYAYANANSLRYADNFGLSAEEVRRIKEKITECIQRMTGAGQRIKGQPYRNNLMRDQAYRGYYLTCKLGNAEAKAECSPNPPDHASFDRDMPNHIKDCGEQAEALRSYLGELTGLDAHWEFRQRAGWTHSWLAIISSDKNGPYITVDP